MAKSTMVELVQELEALVEGNLIPAGALSELIKEAKAGEYHDYKNRKYDCGKIELNTRLCCIGLLDLAERVAAGEFDEEADDLDKAMMRRDTPKELHEILGL